MQKYMDISINNTSIACAYVSHLCIDDKRAE